MTQTTNGVGRIIHYPRFQREINEGKYINLANMKQQESLLKNGEKSENIVTLTGRIMSKRESSNKLIFYDIMHDGELIQVVASKNRFDQPDLFTDMNRSTSRGDIFAFTGVIGKTNHGQLSLFTNKFRLLTPCLHDLPKSGLKDPVSI